MSRNEHIQTFLLAKGWHRKISRDDSYLTEDWANPCYGYHDKQSHDPISPSLLIQDINMIIDELNECRDSTQESSDSKCCWCDIVLLGLTFGLGVLIGHFL